MQFPLIKMQETSKLIRPKRTKENMNATLKIECGRFKKKSKLFCTLLVHVHFCTQTKKCFLFFSRTATVRSENICCITLRFMITLSESSFSLPAAFGATKKVQRK